jgi:hypothetical protein
MSEFENKGKEIRELCKTLVLDFMQVSAECQPRSSGMRQSQIFRNCGLDWGSYSKVTSSQQQFWIVAILSQLKRDGKVEQISESGPWRLR